MNIIKTLCVLGILVSINSCSPKAVEVVNENSNSTEIPIKQIPENPCLTFDELTGSDRDEVETAYVLYKDLVKENKFEEAFSYWKVAYYGAPAANGKVKYQFDDGVKIFTHFYQNANSETEKLMYIDSVMSVYDKRMECFGDEAYTQGRKGFDYYYTFPESVPDSSIYLLFKKNIDAKGKRADYFIINPMTKLLIDGVVDGYISKEEGQKYAKLILEGVDYGLANCKKQYCDAWETIASYAPVRLESLEGIDGFYDCSYYANKYYPRFESDPTNCEVVEEVYRSMLRGNCSEKDERLAQLKQKMATDCYKAPPAPGKLRQGFDAYNVGKYNEAIIHFDDYINSISDTGKQFKYNMLIAKIYYRDVKNYPKSRIYALKAAELDNTSGAPYMLIGKLYASSGPLCGPGTGFDSQVVTWVAVDKFKKAKSIDPAVANEANKLINQYSQYMPSKEDIFVRRIKAGSTYKVKCWINESTKVRTAD